MYKKQLLDLFVNTTSFRRGLFFICWMLGSSTILAHSLSVDVLNKPKLQRGAKLFINYCSGCHSLKYLRYNRMGEDLGLTGFTGGVDEDLLKNSLVFTQTPLNESIRIALPPEDAKQWFGRVPPDLSLIAREKGTAWLYTYLKSFYNDNSRPFGTNNFLAPGVGMPNVLEVMRVDLNHQARSLGKKNKLSADQFDDFLQDLVTFLAYVGEPTLKLRYRLGLFVLAFLALFSLVMWKLKKVYWRK